MTRSKCSLSDTQVTVYACGPLVGIVLGVVMYVVRTPFQIKGGYNFDCVTISLSRRNRRGGVVVKRSPRMREIRVRSPVGTDLSR